MAHAEINLVNGGTGKDTSVRIDDQEITRSVRGFDISAEVGHVPTLNLNLLVIEGMRFEGDVEMIIPNATRDALIKLGWTPPQEMP